MGSARLMGIAADCKGRIGERFFALFTKVRGSSYRITGMGRNTIIKSVAVVAFAVAALGNAIMLEQSNTVTWHDALHAFSMLIGALVAVAIPFIELPE